MSDTPIENQPPGYVPPKVWHPKTTNGGTFASINLPHSTQAPTRVFASGSIMVYLAERFDTFLPKEGRARTETFNWLMWQMGTAPFVGGDQNLLRWYATVGARPAVARGRRVNRRSDTPGEFLLERHDAADFDTLSR